jgi:hypothetical protein
VKGDFRSYCGKRRLPLTRLPLARGNQLPRVKGGCHSGEVVGYRHQLEATSATTFFPVPSKSLIEKWKIYLGFEQNAESLPKKLKHKDLTKIFNSNITISKKKYRHSFFFFFFLIPILDRLILISSLFF